MSNADIEVRIECHQQYSCRNCKSIYFNRSIPEQVKDGEDYSYI